MPAVRNIPTAVHGFNVYNSKSEKLVGISDEVTLPEFTEKAESVSGAGILGSFEETITGMFESQTMEIPFRTIDDDIFKLMNKEDAISLTLRGAIQMVDPSSGKTDYKQMRIAVTGKQKAFKPGKLQAGTQMGASITLELTNIAIELGGKKQLEIDKLNYVYIVDGVDVMKKVRKYC